MPRSHLPDDTSLVRPELLGGGGGAFSFIFVVAIFLLYWRS